MFALITSGKQRLYKQNPNGTASVTQETSLDCRSPSASDMELWTSCRAAARNASLGNRNKYARGAAEQAKLLHWATCGWVDIKTLILWHVRRRK
jgi:hypothetical protein